MIAKFSVKKPYTVVVAVVLVLILGFVSFTKMTPDLLPSINLPYALITTTYIGATPEEVEETVTKPIEQSMATLSGIDSIQSVSAENYSMVILSFQENVNMDSKTVEMREKLDTLKGGWDDTVGTPSILKINPDMLPVVVAAVEVEGMDSEQITNYLKKELLPKIEGTDGVASVSVSGGITTQLNIVLSPDKINAINDQIQTKVAEQLDNAISDLQDAKTELANTKAQLEAGNSAYASGSAAASQGFTEGRLEILKGELTIASSETQIAMAEQQLYAQVAALTGVTYTDLDSLEQALLQFQTELVLKEAELTTAEAQIAASDAQMQEIWSAILAQFVDENGNLINPATGEILIPNSGLRAETSRYVASVEVRDGTAVWRMSDAVPEDGTALVDDTPAAPETPAAAPETPAAVPETPATTPETPAATPETSAVTPETPASSDAPESQETPSSELPSSETPGDSTDPSDPSSEQPDNPSSGVDIPDIPTVDPLNPSDPSETNPAEGLLPEEVLTAYQAWVQYQLAKGQVAESREQINAAKEGIAQALAGITTIRETRNQLTGAKAALATAKANLSTQELSTMSMLNQTGAQLSSGLLQVTTGEAQIDSALSDLEGSYESTLKSADITKTITMDMIKQILAAQNFAMPAGYVMEDGENWLIRVGDKLSGIDEVANLFLFDVGMEGIDPIYLTDVADVFYSNNAADVYAKLNGKDGLLISISKQSNYATAEVSNNVSDTFKKISKDYPGVTFTMLSDQGDYIDLVIDTVLKNLLYGAFLAILVLILFLKDFRPTFVIACSIPISVVFAFVLMYFTGVTLNIISLSGLALGVGMLVDNSVVVIENIYRLRNKGIPAAKAAVSGTVQVIGAITASTLTTVAVFLPIVFVEGLTRELFTDMALTIAFSLFASLIVAMTLVPMMAAGVLRNTHEKPHKVFDFVMKIYRWVLNLFLNIKVVILVGAVALLIFSIARAYMNGTAFMPDMDSTQITVNITMPEGSEFEDTTRMADEVSKRILKIEDVETVGAMAGGTNLMAAIGGGSGGGAGGSGGGAGGSGNTESATLYVILKLDKTASSQEIANQINESCKDLDATVRANGSNSMDMSQLTGSGISIRVTCNNLDDLQEAATMIADALAGVEGVTEVSSGIEDPTPELRITVRKNDAMKQGLTVAQVYAQIAQSLSYTMTATTLTEDNTDYAIIIHDNTLSDKTLDDIRNYEFTLKKQDGTEALIKLGDIADIRETTALSSISRSEQKRYLTVSSRLLRGYNIGLVSPDAERAVAALDLPDGAEYEFSGENEQIRDAFVELGKMLALALVFIYLIMVAQFQSLMSPFIVMFTIPLAFTGGFLGLILWDLEISVIALLGLVMLSGIVVNNGIVLVDYINQLRAEGMSRREAILEAGVARMRPILMTAITTILGLLTMALGVGIGSELMQPIAVVTIGGLTYATFMTLFIVPAMYEILSPKEMKVLSEDELEVVDL